MKQKVLCVTILLTMFFALIFANFRLNNRDERLVQKVISPAEFVTDKGTITLDGIETFDSAYTERNTKLAKSLNITEDEAFILGCFGKYKVKNNIEGRKIKLEFDKNSNVKDFTFYKFEYLPRLENSAFYIKNGKPSNPEAFEHQLKIIRKGKFVILDLDTENIYPISKENFTKTKNFVVIRRSHIKYLLKKHKFYKKFSNYMGENSARQNEIFKDLDYKKANIKILLSDLTTKLIPDRNCTSDICKEMLFQINNSKNTIDMAIYGYSSTPAIEKAFQNALNRGVSVRVVYDLDSSGKNIYPDTFKFVKMFSETSNDGKSAEAGKTMHNKFYIFDKKTVITGSANLSHTDMSGYNSNAVIVINSPRAAEFYTSEFERMFEGKYHNDKVSTGNKTYENMKFFFSPADKAITNGVLPLLRGAKKYIYVPAFVITEKRVTQELINAKKRGVDVRIIADALNASTKHSTSKTLRAAGIPLKAENYAGKMHSKSMIIDDEYVIIGSMNFSYSGENRNDENMVVLKDPDAARFYKKFFLYQWNKIPNRWLKFTPRAEGWDSIGSCTDGLDNNYDGKTDSEDAACKGRGK